ncbi:vWA domain-containing protein [Actinomadura oligospora]|uniref:vWA domain-containing protein n=1 Tax=Actinomadura oligospora TaxID=111804 RepID=UPI0014748BE8|nr:vWA domain-containing protein [Actinomadura oligospora]
MTASFAPAVLLVAPSSAWADAAEATPLDVVVAVDESGSLQPQDVRQEIEAAASIAQSGLNPRTRVTVVGFGSDNGGSEHAVDQYCRPTVIGTAGDLQYLAGCVQGLHRRTAAEGNDTDHVAALDAALSILSTGSPAGAVRTIFLLTDGRLDVPRSPAYGPGSRNAEAERRLKRLFQRARDGRVQIWPLGFGPEVDRPSLDAFAAAGSQQACDQRPDSRPRARVVHDSGQVVRSLVEAYATASCYVAPPSNSGTLNPGGKLELSLQVPDIASNATLTVAKGNSGVRVDFIDPRGAVAPSTGSRDGSTFTRSGQRGTIEALRVAAPLNGTWRVRLTMPPGTAATSVSATVLYQGLIRSTLVAEPPTAQTGGTVTVRLSLLTRLGRVADPAELGKLAFSVVASGRPVGTPRPVTVHDDGVPPDETAHDGTYSGTFKLPAEPGDVTLTGSVAAQGIRSEANPTALVKVAGRPPDVAGGVVFDGGTTVHPGRSVRGTFRMTNRTARPVRARIVVDAPPEFGARLTTPAAVTVPPGGSLDDFAVLVDRRSVLGRAALTVQMVDDADPTKVYVARQRTLSVRKPPGWWARNATAIFIGGTLLVAAGMAWMMVRRARRSRRSVRGLRVQVVRDSVGGALGTTGSAKAREIRAGGDGRWPEVFRFAFRDGVPAHAKVGDQAFEMRRTRDGRIAVRCPDGRTVMADIGTGEDRLEPGLRLLFKDDSRRPFSVPFLDRLLWGPERPESLRPPLESAVPSEDEAKSDPSPEPHPDPTAGTLPASTWRDPPEDKWL